MSRSCISCLLILIAIASDPAISATQCVDPSDVGCFATIQEGIDAAAAGDIILIAPHPDSRGYRENLFIATPDLTLRGDTIAPSANISGQECPAVVLDGCETPSSPAGCEQTVATVAAANTRIERLMIRHGSIQFAAGAEGSVASELCLVGPVSGAISTGVDPVNDLTVEYSVFQGGSFASIDMTGNNIAIRHNQLMATDNGIEIDGGDTLVEFNSIYTCNDECIDTSGDNVRIENNVVIGGDDGIWHDGNNVTITGNVVENMADDNIRVICPVSCTGGVVSGNRLIGNADDDDLLYVTGAIGFLVEDNFMTLAAEHAIDFSGQNSIIRNNIMSRSGSESTSESCLRVSGNGSNLIEGNQIRLCTYQGIEQSAGDNNTYSNNAIEGSGRAGIRIVGGVNTTIDGNTITGGAGEGIANASTGTNITNNTVTGNRTDICNNGTVGSVSGNTFDTGDTTTPCVVN